MEEAALIQEETGEAQQDASPAQQALTLKAALVPLTTLAFSNMSLDDVRNTLQQKQLEAPALFNNLPCVLDLSGLDCEDMPLAGLRQLCLDCGLLIVAVRNVGPEWSAQLADLQLADLGKGNIRRNLESVQAEQADASPAEDAQQAPATVSSAPLPLPQRAIKVHVGNIRSGQQLYFDGDLIVQGTVNPGAEVLATGDIHVYGALRGRVLAGIKGDESAVIACVQFDGELIAIAGHYRLFEEPHPDQNQSVVIRLVDDNLQFQAMS